MLIAQLSDPHFVPGVRLFGRVDTAGCLERAVAHLNGLDLDAVLITGDLTHDAMKRSTPRSPGSSASCACPVSC